LGFGIWDLGFYGNDNSNGENRRSATSQSGAKPPHLPSAGRLQIATTPFAVAVTIRVHPWQKSVATF
jgi:hypothetical protein